MTAFIRGLFGGKPKTETTEETVTVTQPKKESKEFFLSPDEAKTFGDVDYMRKEVTIRRTFPNVKNGVKEEAVEMLSEVSAMEMKTTGENNFIDNSSVIEEIKAETTEVVSERRRTDSGMDMFRNMAKDLRK